MTSVDVVFAVVEVLLLVELVRVDEVKVLVGDVDEPDEVGGDEDEV